MDCYKLIIKEDTFGVKDSQELLHKMLDEIFGGSTHSDDEYEFMYENTNTYPKVYYFNTSKEAILNKLKSKYTVKEAEYPSDALEDSPNFLYLGNGNFFPSKS